MFERIINFFKKLKKSEKEDKVNSKDTAKERLHLVLMQDRANVSADFLELMKQEIIEVIKKYIEVDEAAIDVRLTNKSGDDGTVGAPSLYANIPIVTIKNDARKLQGKKEEKNEDKDLKEQDKSEEKQEQKDKVEEQPSETVENVNADVNEDKDDIAKEEQIKEEVDEKGNKEDTVSDGNENNNEVNNEKTNS